MHPGRSDIHDPRTRYLPGEIPARNESLWQFAAGRGLDLRRFQGPVEDRGGLDLAVEVPAYGFASRGGDQQATSAVAQNLALER